MPASLDPHQVLAERNRFIDAHIDQHVHELEEMLAMMGNGGMDSILDDTMKEDKETLGNKLALIAKASAHPSPDAHGKLRALIELKSLWVLDKRRAMRALVTERLTHGSLLPLNHTDFQRVCKPMIRDARMTEQLERKQRADRERCAKQKHIEQLSVICAHGREVLTAARTAQNRVIALGHLVLGLHILTEKEKQKRIKRISREHLKALKADDEEAYMKLIDTAKVIDFKSRHKHRVEEQGHTHDNHIGSLEVQTETTCSGRQDEDLVLRILVVEHGDVARTILCLGATIQTQILPTAHLQEVFHDVHDFRHLEEDENLQRNMCE